MCYPPYQDNHLQDCQIYKLEKILVQIRSSSRGILIYESKRSSNRINPSTNHSISTQQFIKIKIAMDEF